MDEKADSRNEAISITRCCKRLSSPLLLPHVNEFQHEEINLHIAV